MIQTLCNTPVHSLQMQPTTPPPLPPILRLPPEARLQIYNYFNLVQDDPISIFEASVSSPAIGRVCKVMREEVMDGFYNRNRFIISNAMGLVDVLRKITPENVGRKIRLRLQHSTVIRVSGNDIRFGYGSPADRTLVFIDVDMLSQPPWIWVTGAPIDTLPREHVHLAIEVRNRNLCRILADVEEEAQSESLLDQARFLLVPKVMARVLQPVVYSSGGGLISLHGQMLEYIVKHWLWTVHILECTESQPLVCKKCERALMRLGNARDNRQTVGS